MSFLADNSIAENLVINGSTADGIDMSGSFCSILDDYVGTDPTGMTQASTPNALSGISLTGSFNTISGCVVSGNTYDGINIGQVGSGGVGNEGNGGSGGGNSEGLVVVAVITQQTAADFNVIEGNRIGVNLTGTAAVPNGYSGVVLENGASYNTVGGTTTANANVISGNGADGVNIYGNNTYSNNIYGNHIGVDSSGVLRIPNLYSGIGILNGAAFNTVGGTVAGAANMLSGNKLNGVVISGAGSNGR